MERGGVGKSRDIYWKGRELVERKAAESKGGEKKQNLSLLLFFPHLSFSQVFF